MAKKIISKNNKDTQKLAEQLAKKILRSNVPPRARLARGGKSQRSKVLALTGDLGAGKTTFVQGFLRALEIKRRVMSPTFLIFKTYEIKSRVYKKAYHVDCYRLHKPSDITKLGFKEILKKPENIILIEWAEKIKKILPKNTIWIKFFHGKKENERLIYVQ